MCNTNSIPTFYLRFGAYRCSEHLSHCSNMSMPLYYIIVYLFVLNTYLQLWLIVSVQVDSVRCSFVWFSRCYSISYGIDVQTWYNVDGTIPKRNKNVNRTWENKRKFKKTRSVHNVVVLNISTVETRSTICALSSWLMDIFIGCNG